MSEVLVVGGGVVGLAVAARLARRGDRVTVLEKEPGLAEHQTGHNSGVLHSGLYYAPGSLKARMAAAGQRSMAQYAAEHGVPVERPGKLVVATEEAQVPRLRALAERAAANGVPAHLIGPDEARGYEPHVRCVQALRVESTGIVDYRGVCAALADDVRGAGGCVLTGVRLHAAREDASGVRVRIVGPAPDDRRELHVDALVACAGLQADRVARACGLDPRVRIVPFRGEYYELRPEARHLVRGLIYPVPDPRFPFLGVHFTRGVDGSVHAGPNAVLALAREGYTWRDVVPADVVDELSWPGLWRMAKFAVPGAFEMARSASLRLFTRSLAGLVPDIEPDDLVPAPAGVRAQAITRDGSMVDDFLLERTRRQVHVLNAPSPAATAALEIATHIVAELDR